jgi:hypothetical protein
MKIIISFMLMVLSAAAIGQPASKEKKASAEKKAADERQRSFGGQVDKGNLKGQGTLPQPKNSSDTVQTDGATDSKSIVSSHNGHPQSGSNSQAQKSNAPAVIQSTSSESGSPSILSNENGSGRDGTNNVQRAKPNIAGAEVPSNMNIEQRNTPSGRTISGESGKRKGEEHPTAERTQNATTRMDAAKNGELSKDSKHNQQPKKAKSKKKNRRNRDSGK